jgi:catechol 2,3-dioxygenase-like lactoylglutathione lyase family enzyme
MRQAILFLKGGSGSGNHGHRGRVGQRGGSLPNVGNRNPSAKSLPSSQSISTAKEARHYWKSHIAGRTLSLPVRVKAGEFSVRVNFSDTNTHMWTHASKPGEKIVAYDRPATHVGPRSFDGQRAKLMDHLFSTIATPWRVFDSPDGRHLYLESGQMDNGDPYVVVLEPNGQRYDFVSSRPRTKKEIARIRNRSRPVKPHGERRLGKSKAPRIRGASRSVLHGLLGHPIPDSLNEPPLPSPSHRTERPVEALFILPEMRGLCKLNKAGPASTLNRAGSSAVGRRLNHRVVTAAPCGRRYAGDSAANIPETLILFKRRRAA